MSKDILIPKMTRLDRKKKRIRIPLINFVVIFFGTLLIIAATFLNLEIKHYIIPAGLFSHKLLTPEDFVYSFCLIPQIPVVMFVCSVLGKKMALTSVFLYIIAGLFFIPVFALGGGLKYFGEYGFGYILAYIPAVFIAGNILSKKYSFSKMFKAAIFGVLTIHILGILYMVIIALIKQSGITFIQGWINAQSGLKIIYDIITSFVLMTIGKFFNEGLKYLLR